MRRLPAAFGGGLAPRTVAADGTPSVTSVTPYDGPSGGGTPIVIAGSLFTGATDVLLGGSDLTPCPATPSCFTFVDDNEIDVVTPPATAGTFDVQVITSGGTSLTSPADQYTYLDAPTVTSVATPQSEGATGDRDNRNQLLDPRPPGC